MRRPSNHFAAALAIALAIGALTLLQRDQIWSRERLWSTDWANSAIILLGPIAAGLGYLDAREFRRGGQAELSAASARPRHALVRAILRTYAPLAVGHAITIATAMILAATQTGGLPRLANTPAALALLLTCTALGWLTGQFTTTLLLAPVLVVATFAGQVLLFGHGLTPLLQVGGATNSLVGLVTNTTHVSLQTFALCALACLLIHATTNRYTIDFQPLARRLTTTALAMTFLIASAYLLTEQSGRFSVTAPPDLICRTGEHATVCLEHDYANDLSIAVDLADRTTTRLATANIQAPTHYEHGIVLRTSDLPAGTANIAPANDTLTAADFAREVVFTAILHCPDRGTALREQSLYAATVIFQWWILLDLDPAEADAIAHQLPPSFLARTTEEQTAWITTSAVALSQCRTPAQL